MTAFLVLYDVLFVLVFCLVYGAATFAGVGVVQGLGGSPWLAPVGVLAGLITVIGVTSALHALVPRPPGGAHKVGSPTFICWGLRFLIQRQLCLFPTRQLIHYVSLLRFLTYRSLGSRIAFTTSISSDAVILDWDRLHAGPGVVLGTEVRVYTHYLDRGKLILGDVHLAEGALLTALVCVGPFVRLGKGARVDPEARVASRVIIEDGARVGPRAVIREDSVVRAGARVPERAWIDKGSVVGGLLLAFGAVTTLSACPLWPDPIPLPPVEATPTIAITSPDPEATVTTAPDGDRTVLIAFDVEAINLKAPGTCLTGDMPCGHVRVAVDGGACSSVGDAFNSIAVTSPAQAHLARCDVAAGSHTVRLLVAHDDGSPWLDDHDEEVAAEVALVGEVPDLLVRMGGVDGLEALAVTMVARQLQDPKINAYFRNASIDHATMSICLADVFESLATSQAPGDSDCSMDMAQVHAGLGISMADFDDWMAQLYEAMSAVGVAPADAWEFGALLEPMSGTIVEDPGNDATLYQRLGRRPGLEGAVGMFAGKLLMDPIVARYFLNDAGMPDYSETFALCLVRLLGSLDGPFIYGEGFPLEPLLLDEGRACRSMSQAHSGLASAAPESAPIGGLEFTQVVGALHDTLHYLEVPPADIELLVEAMNLPGLCPHIVADATECDLLFPPVVELR